ncbi:hypothetical protein ASPFODRAFT_43874 [Aspergillus luchuensis CBS 106.47]|uniref:Uncharacterized protein n=1 Tax=Aspergillus luchuensis (strain CBS 106.47) TaxID=1137211 RepID=A0A1M3TNJ3_ASPLC|nr:hypothetical protein ASPFODRAFT_43874 [Aspergillus luchuensis CBS 106.47]
MVSLCVWISPLGDRCMHHLQEDPDPYFTYIITILFLFYPLAVGYYSSQRCIM